MWEPIIGGADVAQPIPDDVTTVAKYATATDGTPITMRWCSKDGATAETPGPAVVFFHGGGYVFGHIDQFDGAVSRHVSASGVPFLSVEFRRAPEHPFPTPLEDGYYALRWLHHHALELGSTPTGCSATRPPPTPSNSAARACQWSSTCTPASHTSSTPSTRLKKPRDIGYLFH